MFHKRTGPVLILFIILLLCLICSISYAENLLYNGSFTEADEDGLPVDWYTDAYIQDEGYTVFSLETGDAEHPYCVEIQNIGGNDARFAQFVEVEPESFYRFSGYILADNVTGGHGANLSVEGIYAFSEKWYDTDGQWQYVEYYGETGPEQEYITVFARLGGYSGESKGKAAFADLSLTKVDTLPEDVVPDLWFREDAGTVYDEETYTEEDSSSSGARLWLLLIGSAYALCAAAVITRFSCKKADLTENKQNNRYLIAAVFSVSLILRLLLAWFVEGYMVDVNCFTSWGHTMASAGPAQFYQATNFCDYPPLYTYVLGLNSIVSGLFPGSQAFSRVVFRFIPSVCDLIACWLIYRLALKQKQIGSMPCFLLFAFLAFNPATILNSAAWGQMDSVLCLLLLVVALQAVEGRWTIALPVYVVSVLVKPQALMLGPLGLAYIILTFVKSPQQRRSILTGCGYSLVVLIAGLLPFSLKQDWNWIIRLYSGTLASYPYATVNTANFYYLLGGNWSSVSGASHLLAPLLLCFFSLCYACWWYFRAKKMSRCLTETILGILFSIGFALCASMKASWAWTGGLAMAFAFVIVLSIAIRSGNIRLLTYLGGILYILLYAFGVKMHERYVFPALLLLAAAFVYLKDRRILYLLILVTVTTFLNEGIVLDNSIRLGSSYGHLNQDTVFLADMISLFNCIGGLYAVWLGIELLIAEPSALPVKESEGRKPEEWKCDRKLYWTSRDTVILGLITIIYSAVSLLTLGSTKAPQTCWSSSSAEERIVFDLGGKEMDFSVLYFGQVSRNDFSVAVSDDGINWGEEIPAQMDQGQCWKWKYVTESYDNGSAGRNYLNNDESNIIRFTGRYFRLSACQLGLKLNEIIFRDTDGRILPATVLSRSGEASGSELYSDPENLLDEQDTLEKLPSFPANAEADGAPAQPSWWNSTYFDEIYHARTAYEFLQGTVPYETSHPPLGKLLMSVTVAIFGMTPFGWRFAGALAGILMLPGIYLLGKQLTKKTSLASVACLLMALDCMHLTQTQIATIDSFPVLFIIFACFFMLRFLQTDFMQEKISRSLISLGFSGFFMGLAIASKWIGIYAGAGLAVLFFWHCIRVIRHELEASGKSQSSSEQTDAYATARTGAIHRFLVICLWCVLFFVVIPVIIYFVSYIPYMAYNAKRIHSLWDYISEVWRSQVGMLNYHSTKNLGMDHPFYSPWWEWPIIGKPMYYASQQYIPDDFPVHHSIFCFGNPVIWYGGLAALLICLVRFASAWRYRKEGSVLNWHLRSTTYEPRYVFLFVSLLAQYLPWVLVPRGTYIYHYFASIPFLMLAVMLCFDRADKGKQRTLVYAGYAFVLAAAVFFILLFPYASGINVSSGWLDIGRNMLRIWY